MLSSLFDAPIKVRRTRRTGAYTASVDV